MKPKPALSYQNILRTIGQSLENFNANSFDLLAVSENEFVVGGNCKRAKIPRARKPSLKKSFLSLFRNNDKPKTARTSVLARFNFVGLRFTREDIELLDRKGKVLRSRGNCHPPNPHSIAQMLRMTGGYLDSKGGCLLGLSWRHKILTLWHLNGLGVEVKEVYTRANLYDLWVHQLMQRKPLHGLKPTGSD